MKHTWESWATGVNSEEFTSLFNMQTDSNRVHTIDAWELSAAKLESLAQ